MRSSVKKRRRCCTAKPPLSSWAATPDRSPGSPRSRSLARSRRASLARNSRRERRSNTAGAGVSTYRIASRTQTQDEVEPLLEPDHSPRTLALPLDLDQPCVGVAGMQRPLERSDRACGALDQQLDAPVRPRRLAGMSLERDTGLAENDPAPPPWE